MSERVYEFKKEEIGKININSAIFKTSVQQCDTAEGVTVVTNVDEERFPYICELNGNELILKFRNLNIKLERDEYRFVSANSYIRITIPSDMNLTNMDIKVSAGSVQVDLPQTKIEKTSFEVGAGKLSVDRLNIESKASFEIGAGEGSIKGVCCEDNTNLFIQTGVGSANVETNGKGNYVVECGLGSVVLKLAEEYEYYNYNMSCGLGKIEINGNKVGKIFGSSQNVNNVNANHTLKADCGLGIVRIFTNGYC